MTLNQDLPLSVWNLIIIYVRIILIVIVYIFRIKIKISKSWYYHHIYTNIDYKKGNRYSVPFF